jgi:hypothetical protein
MPVVGDLPSAITGTLEPDLVRNLEVELRDKGRGCAHGKGSQVCG